MARVGALEEGLALYLALGIGRSQFSRVLGQTKNTCLWELMRQSTLVKNYMCFAIHYLHYLPHSNAIFKFRFRGSLFWLIFSFYLVGMVSGLVKMYMLVW